MEFICFILDQNACIGTNFLDFLISWVHDVGQFWNLGGF